MRTLHDIQKWSIFGLSISSKNRGLTFKTSDSDFRDQLDAFSYGLNFFEKIKMTGLISKSLIFAWLQKLYEKTKISIRLSYLF